MKHSAPNGSLSQLSQPIPGAERIFNETVSRLAPEQVAAFFEPVDHHFPAGRRRLVYLAADPVHIEIVQVAVALRDDLWLTVYERGETGMDALLIDPPDLVLLDANLPDMEGITLLQRLRATPQCARLPIVIVSAEAMDEHVANSMHCSATHFLPHPFALVDLIRLLDPVVDRLMHAGASAPVIPLR